MRRRWAITACLAFLVLTAGCSGGSDGGTQPVPQTVQVGSSDTADYDTIQAAIAAVPAGSTILVEEGTYEEVLRIQKPLSLIGSGILTEIEVTGAGQPDPDDTGGDTDAVIEIRETGDVRIEGVSVQGPKDGILVRDSADVIIVSVVASGNGDEGVDVRNSRDVFVSGTFENNGDEGVQVREGSERVTVDGSKTSSNAQDGIKIRDSSDCTVSGNTSTSNGDDGILVRDSSGVDVTGNTVIGNIGFGIRINNAPDTFLEGNTVNGNIAGDIEID